MLVKLPRWVLVNKFPALYDTESLTVIEQTARLYGKMNELIDSYNKYVEDVNKTIEEWITASDEDRETFEVAMRQEFQDFINVVDLKIRELEKYCKDNLTDTVNALWREMEEQGHIQDLINKTLAEISTTVDEFKALMTKQQSDFETEITTLYNSLADRVGTLETSVSTNDGRLQTLENKPEHILVYKPGTKDLSIKGVNSTTQENLFTKPYPIESSVIPEGVTVNVSNDGTITIVVDGTVTQNVNLPIGFYNAPVGTYEVSLPKSITTDKEYDFDTAMWYHYLKLENPATMSKILDIDLEMYSVKNENKFISFDVAESGPLMLNYIYASGSLTSDSVADRVEIVIHPQLYKE